MTGYDPEARRDTPLALKLKARIRSEGPITVGQYMAACLQDPEHGYYVKRPAIGANADFITAPEISQVFGELVGLWCAVVWRQMGAPPVFNLIEYGPGRGTMLADALRALRVVPECRAAARVRLVESNVLLREAQRQRLAELNVPVSWHSTIREEVEPLPAIVLANEVLDACPVEQFLSAGGRTWPRGVGLDDNGRLEFCASMRPGDEPSPAHAVLTEVRELDPSVDYDMTSMPVCAGLFIDYGHAATQPGDTLQAVRGHAMEHPLCSPGEADLTAQVDFERFGVLCKEAAFAVDGPVTQAEFLGALGMVERARRLMDANPGQAGEIETGVARLMSPTGMGTRFKAIGVRSPSLPPLPGFALSPLNV